MQIVIDIDEDKYHWLKENNPKAKKDSIVGAIVWGKPLPKVHGNQTDLGNHEIIPCKECKWHGYLTCSNPDGIKGWVTDNDFCSYVERRETDVI